MDKFTNSLHHRVDTRGLSNVVTPIYQNSAFPADSPYFYSRKDNPNVRELEECLAIIEDARFCIGYSTGMAAINSVISLLRCGSKIVLNRDIYGCSMKLFMREAKRLDMSVVVLDLSMPSEFSKLPKETDLVFFETPTNPFLKTIDIQKISQSVKKQNPEALIVVDNTWASPLFQQPISSGADISLHSGTKYISGHSDVMGGFAVCNNETLHQELRNIRFFGGSVLDPNSAWLMRRSIQTLDIRMQAHAATILETADFLKTLTLVKKVYLPHIDGHQLNNYGGILFFELAKEVQDRYEDLRENLELFGSGTGMAAVTSMIAQPYSGSHASLSESEKAQMGIGKNLVRLCFGLERAEDLIADLRNGFRGLET